MIGRLFSSTHDNREQDRDRAAHHAAPGAHARAARGAARSSSPPAPRPRPARAPRPGVAAPLAPTGGEPPQPGRRSPRRARRHAPPQPAPAGRSTRSGSAFGGDAGSRKRCSRNEAMSARLHPDRAGDHGGDRRGARLGRAAAQRARGAARQGAGPAPRAARHPRRDRRLQAGLATRAASPKRAGESGYPKQLEDLVEGVEDQKNPKQASGSTSCAACRATRSPPNERAHRRRDLGQAQLRQPARRAARGRGRVRRLHRSPPATASTAARTGNGRRKDDTLGFTLIELLVVWRSSRTLLTLAVPRYFAASTSRRRRC